MRADNNKEVDYRWIGPVDIGVAAGLDEKNRLAPSQSIPDGFHLTNLPIARQKRTSTGQWQDDEKKHGELPHGELQNMGIDYFKKFVGKREKLPAHPNPPRTFYSNRDYFDKKRWIL